MAGRKAPSQSTKGHKPPDQPPTQEGNREVERILEGVERDSERIGFSNMDLLRRPPEDDLDDPIVILGKKIGKTLGYVALAALIYLLVRDYY